ncbi:F-box protein [Kocuria palustris]|nr:F-box protein [Kocuria palustris]
MITKLPDDIFFQLAIYLEYGDLLRLRSVCKQLERILASHWDTVCRRCWGLAWSRFHLKPQKSGLDQILELSHRKFWIMKQLDTPSLALISQLSPQDLPILLDLFYLSDPWSLPPDSVIRHGYLELMIQALSMERGVTLLREGLAPSLWHGLDMIFNKYYYKAKIVPNVSETLHENVYIKHMFPYVMGSKGILHFPLETIYLQIVLRAIKVVVKEVFCNNSADTFEEVDRYCLLKVYEGHAPAAPELALAIVREQLLRFFGGVSMAIHSEPFTFEANLVGIFLKVGGGYFYLRPRSRATSNGPYYKVEAFTQEEVFRYLQSSLSLGTQQIQSYLQPVAQESIYTVVQLAQSLNLEVRFSQYVLKLIKLTHVQETGIALFQRHSKLQEYLSKFGSFAIYLPVIHRSMLEEKSQLLLQYFKSIESLKIYKLPNFNVDLTTVAASLNKTHHVIPVNQARSVEVISTGEPAIVLGQVRDHHWLVYSPKSAYMVLADESIQSCQFTPRQVAKMCSCQPAIFYPNAFKI